jgi:hypothetical protein
MKSSSKVVLTAILIPMLMAFTGVRPSLGAKQGVSGLDATSGASTNFQAGEEIVYKIYYNLNFVWIPAGEVVFKVSEENNKFHLAATGQTYSSYNWFFKVNDTYDSYIDKTTLLPSTAVRDIKEGKYKLYDKVNFDQEGKVASYERGEHKGAIERKGNINLGDKMHDILSIIYYSRSIDYSQYAPNTDLPVKVLLDEEVYPLKVRYLGKEEKNIKGLGKFNTLKMSPQVVSGQVFKEGTQMKIWASDDANKIPLMIESPVSVGSVKIVLKSYKGLKYDLSAKKG